MFSSIVTTLTRKTALLEEIATLRNLVWKQEGASFDSEREILFVDALDTSPDCYHTVVFFEGRVVAAARLSAHRSIDDFPDVDKIGPYASPTDLATVVSLNRMVVSPEFRGLGLANFLDNVRLAKALSLGAQEIFAVAYDHHRKNSMEKRGFKVLDSYDFDEEFQLEGPFFIMSLLAEDSHLSLPTRIHFYPTKAQTAMTVEVA